MKRRHFNSVFFATIAGVTSGLNTACMGRKVISNPLDSELKLSLAQYSLHRTIRNGELDNLDFAMMAQRLGFSAVEYVSQFFQDKSKDGSYLKEMKSRAADNGIRSLLIMVDLEGHISDVDKLKRNKAIENHKKWIDAAAYLECHSIRINLFGNQGREEVAKAAVEGLNKLCDISEKANIDVLVENHGQYSSDGAWLADVMKRVDRKSCGTLPDFGNFCVRREGGELWGAPCVEEYDKYKGVEEMLPFAKAISAKSFEFDDEGNEIGIDFYKMMDLIIKSNYQGYIGVEYEGSKHSEIEGIQLTKELLERVQSSR